MKNYLQKLVLLVAVAVFTFSCGKDDEGPGSIEGSWSYQSLDIDEIKINDEDFETILENLGYSPSRIEDFKNEIKSRAELPDYKLTINSGGTWSDSDGDSGTYSLSTDRKTFTLFDVDGLENLIFHITELTTKHMTMYFSYEEEADVNEDGIDESTIKVKISLHFTRV